MCPWCHCMMDNNLNMWSVSAICTWLLYLLMARWLSFYLSKLITYLFYHGETRTESHCIIYCWVQLNFSGIKILLKSLLCVSDLLTWGSGTCSLLSARRNDQLKFNFFLVLSQLPVLLSFVFSFCCRPQVIDSYSILSMLNVFISLIKLIFDLTRFSALSC